MTCASCATELDGILYSQKSVELDVAQGGDKDNSLPHYLVNTIHLRFPAPPPPPPSSPALKVTSELTLDTDASPDGFSYSSLVIAAGATLKATGFNPLIINVANSVDIQGTIDR